LTSSSLVLYKNNVLTLTRNLKIIFFRKSVIVNTPISMSYDRKRATIINQKYLTAIRDSRPISRLFSKEYLSLFLSVIPYQKIDLIL